MAELERTISRRIASFSRRLRRAGLGGHTDATTCFTRSLNELDPVSIKDIYWAGRLSFVKSAEEVAIFEREFFAFTRGEENHDPPGPQQDEEIPSSRSGAEPSASDDIEMDGAEQRDEVPGTVSLASSTELLKSKNFARLTLDEREKLKRLIASIDLSPPLRRSRRTEPSRRGAVLDLRAMLQAAMKVGGEPAIRHWQSEQLKHRRTVFLLDVSGSMKDYSRALLQFAYAARRRQPRAEVFCFGTTVSRVTDLLEASSVDRVLAEVGKRVPDWEGGTRLGDSLRRFIDDFGRRGVARGAVVLICSDGLERGDPEALALQMRRLGALAHAVVWVNPLKGSPEYKPLARGMAAALPYIDRFLSGHDLNSLEELAGVLSDFGTRRTR